MAGPLLSRSPTCIACLRRLTRPLGSVNAGTGSVSVMQMQTRGKRTRPQDQGVVVRLLEDIPKFGRKDAVFRVERGRMRNEWYPSNKAEYMTATRFQELGLTREDIGERDRVFGTFAPLAEEIFAARPTAPVIEVQQVAPVQASALLASLLPETLTFYRKPLQTPTPTPTPTPVASIPRSPLIASASSPSPAAAAASQEGGKSGAAQNTQGIFGSVSATDIVNEIKKVLMADVEASRIPLEPENIRFVGVEGEADRLKALGRWEVEISITSPGSDGKSAGLKPVRKTIEILPAEEAAE
ncbi:hypothetical protein QBC46DRAFT_381511 [Diplogelasinospora grovesii]|uniref:Ribosomal protein L9 domain-containing protein n=1 Tax=Diplogelasinospora grovesii TaxID=303347 RepID=A0AAN6NAG8_9PEZI|nr:hypothetical protein QBC46DRAFT_381511 [Diplogelasinospora grovesii]